MKNSALLVTPMFQIIPTRSGFRLGSEQAKCLSPLCHLISHMGIDFKPRVIPPCLRSQQGRAVSTTLQMGKEVPSLCLRWAGLIFSPWITLSNPHAAYCQKFF